MTHESRQKRSRIGARARALALALCIGILTSLLLPCLCLCQLAVYAAQPALTPLQREIERQRARLSSADAEERRDAVTRLGAMRRPDASRAATLALNDRDSAAALVARR